MRVIRKRRSAARQRHKVKRLTRFHLSMLCTKPVDNFVDNVFSDAAKCRHGYNLVKLYKNESIH